MASDIPRPKTSPLYGSLDLLILNVLHRDGPLHGLEIADQIRERSEDHLKIEEGALYPALHRLQRQGLLLNEWRVSDKGRRAKFYDLSPSGSVALEEEIDRWRSHTRAVGRVLDVPVERLP
jgi:PadR family transcriptional regulator PadR